MKAEFVIQRQGKSFVLYAGLLDLATERGLTGIEVEALQITATLAVFKATAIFADGRRFSSHGDASPDNVGRTIAPHFIRMAETRSKARALRDALNIGAAALEELGPDEEVTPTVAPAVRAPSPIRPPAPPRPPPTPIVAAAAPAIEPVSERTRLLCAGFIDAAQRANPRLTISLLRDDVGEVGWLNWLEMMSAKLKVPVPQAAAT